MNPGMRKLSKLTFFLAVALGLGGWLLSQNQTMAGSKVLVGHLWSTSERLPMDRIDHDAWDQLLQKFVDEDGFVDYAAWNASAEDVRQLDQYLNHLSQVGPDMPSSREGALAFWINAYNAVTVKGILREYPTDSIRNHTGLIGYNIWKDLLLIAGDQKVSLDHIEHQILRKMSEPRIHFAIVCASIGCPRLLNRAFRAELLEQQLTDNAKHFFATPSKFRHEAGSKTLHVSPVLQWFGGDFGADSPAQARAIAPYLPAESSRQLAASGQAEFEYLDYDWSLNDQQRR